jgi:hypothetical protein
MKHDGIHLNEATLEQLQTKLHAVPQRERRRTHIRRFTTGISAAAAAVALLVWLRPEPTAPSAQKAEDWLHQTTTLELMESLETNALESNAEELGTLLTDEELSQLSLAKNSKS